MCKLNKCDSTAKPGYSSSVTCNDAKTAEYTLPIGETSIKLQVRDEQLGGNIDCIGSGKADGSSQCCGDDGRSGCACDKSVAVWDIPVSSCGVSSDVEIQMKRR